MTTQDVETRSLRDVAHFMYGDVRSDRGFWYSHPLHEIDGLDEEQLFWVPYPKSLCMLWHVGHIAHRERTHVGQFLQGLDASVIPVRHYVFGTEWVSVDQIRQSIDSIEDVFSWVEDVRNETTRYIESLAEEDYLCVLPTSDFGERFSIAHWLFLTVAHGAIHVGRIQMMRAMLEGKYDRTC